MEEQKKHVKKPWKTPELIVLVRNTPEEAVLTSCKTYGASGYHGTNNGCMWESVCSSVCSSISSS